MSWFNKVKDAAVKFDEAYCKKCAAIEEKIFKKPLDKKVSQIKIPFAKVKTVKPSGGYAPVDKDAPSRVKVTQSEKKATVKKVKAEATKSTVKKIAAKYDRKDMYRYIGVGIVSGTITAIVGWQIGIGVLATYAGADIAVKGID